MIWNVLCAAGVTALFLWALFRCIQVAWQRRAEQTRAKGPVPVSKQQALGLLCWVAGTTVLIYAAGMLAWYIQTGEPNAGKLFGLAFDKLDGLHYLEIANNGYTAVGETRYFIVFFPLFPLLVRLGMVFFSSALWSACFVNFVCLYGACLFLYKLLALHLPQEQAYRGVKYFLLFPMALFLHIAYSEALFMLLLTAQLYYAQRRKFALSALWGFGCALTRITGVLCAVALVVEAFWQAWEKDRFHGGRFFKKALWALAPCLGLLAYLGLNAWVTGQPFMFLIHQK